MKVICISGKARSGKDTVGALLANELTESGKRVVITHYADLLKYILTMYFDWDGKKDEKGRALLQKVGTDIVRQKSKNFWVDFLISVANIFGDKWDYMIIPDARFTNEIECWKYSYYDVISIRVERSVEHEHLVGGQAEHISETQLDNYPFDYYIKNNDLEQTEKQIKALIMIANL